MSIMNEKINLFKDGGQIPEVLDEELEAEFSDKQRTVRKEMFEYLTKSMSGRKQMDENQIVLKSCPKISQGFQEQLQSRVYRGTNFRGVSRNGRCNWQILTMIDGQKVYLGTVDNILKAAILYDIVSIQSKGLAAKTNFIYRKCEIIAVLMLQNLMQIKEKGMHYRKQ